MGAQRWGYTPVIFQAKKRAGKRIEISPFSVGPSPGTLLFTNALHMGRVGHSMGGLAGRGTPWPVATIHNDK